jgi:hypothetical protein
VTLAPIRPDLWQVTLQAARGARAKGLEHIASGKYFPKKDVPRYESNEHGWSTTTSRDLIDRRDSPPNWHYMFGTKPGPFAAISYDDVPELKHAAEKIRDVAMADEQLARGISLLAGGERDPEARARQIEFEYIRFVADLIGRAEATGVTSDEQLLDIYLLLERARFSEELRGDLVVPIALTPLDLPTPLNIADGVWIEPLDQAMQRARAVSHLEAGGKFALVIAAATHAVAIRDVIIPNGNRLLRIVGQVELDLTSVDRLIQCLHIASGRDTGYAQVLVRPSGWADAWVHDLPAVLKVSTLHRYPEKFDDGAWNKPQALINRADIERIPRLFSALHAAPANVQLAARRAMRAVMRSDDEDKTLDATIGIEALLLANNARDEMTHRMAQRAAAALAPDYPPEGIYPLIKKVYEHRSAIVHGRTRRQSTINIGDEAYPAQDVAGILLRLLLMNWLQADEPWTPEILDRRLLRSLLPQELETAD